MSKFSEYLDEQEKEYGDKFDSTSLDHRFIKAFNSGERIRVKIFDRVMTGTVGVTTGWKPVFLLMRRRDSIGSCDIMDKNAEFTTMKCGYYGD